MRRLIDEETDEAVAVREANRFLRFYFRRMREAPIGPDLSHRRSLIRTMMTSDALQEAIAHNAVKASIEKILKGRNAGDVIRDELSEWNRALWTPSVQAGILKPSELAGYRNGPVYIKNANHVPPPREAVRDCMPDLFDRLGREVHPAARASLVHAQSKQSRRARRQSSQK